MNEDRLLTVNEVAALCGIGVRTVWRFRDSGQLPAPVQLGGAIRWKHSTIQAWLAADCPDARNWTAAAPTGRAGA